MSVEGPRYRGTASEFNHPEKGAVIRQREVDLLKLQEWAGNVEIENICKTYTTFMSEASVTFAKMAKADAITRLQYEKDEGVKLPPKVVKVVKVAPEDEELYSPVKVKSKKGKSFAKKRESKIEKVKDAVKK